MSSLLTPPFVILWYEHTHFGTIVSLLITGCSGISPMLITTSLMDGIVGHYVIFCWCDDKGSRWHVPHRKDSDRPIHSRLFRILALARFPDLGASFPAVEYWMEYWADSHCADDVDSEEKIGCRDGKRRIDATLHILYQRQLFRPAQTYVYWENDSINLISARCCYFSLFSSLAREMLITGACPYSL